jgi:Fe2+ or Zn2+ uptake regulation protein
VATQYDKEATTLHIECDECGTVEDFWGEDFADCIAEAKASGWIIILNQQQYEHYCSNCRD